MVKVECDNCGDAFWCHDLNNVGGLARDLHEHWRRVHGDGGIHIPHTTVYTIKGSGVVDTVLARPRWIDRLRYRLLWRYFDDSDDYR